MLVLRMRLLFFALSLEGFDVFWIGNGAGNYIASAGPFPEIDQPATLAAEREVGVIPQDKLAAGGTTKAEDFFPRHDSILNRSDR